MTSTKRTGSYSHGFEERKKEHGEAEEKKSGDVTGRAGPSGF